MTEQTETSGERSADERQELARRRLERGLTLGGRGRRGDGEVESATKDKYAKYLVGKKFVPWCRQQGLSAMPASSETVALFAQDMAERHAVQTVRMAVSAVRWWHRSYGHPPPDQLAAWYVLGVYKPESNRPAALRARPVSDGELSAMVEAAGPVPERQMRDRALLLLMWGVGLGPERITRLNLDHVTSVESGMRVRLGDHSRVVDHDHTGGEVLCAACAVEQWRAAVLGWGAGGLEPLMRQVDRHGNVAGFGPVGRPRVDVRMTPTGVGRIVKRLMTRVQLPAEVLDRPSFNVRLGGALAARRLGASRGAVAARLGYEVDSRALLEYLAWWDSRGSDGG